MSFEDYMRLAGALLTSLGGGAVIIFALSSWLGKVWAKRILAEEAHKLQVIRDANASELQMLRDKSQVRFSRLHEKQAMLIGELYEKLYTLDHRLRQVKARIYLGTKTKRNPDVAGLLEEFRQKRTEFREYFKRNVIYFSEDLCRLIEGLESIFGSATYDYTISQFKKDQDQSEILAKLESAIKSWDSQINDAMRDIRKQFRVLLGVSNESTK